MKPSRFSLLSVLAAVFVACAPAPTVTLEPVGPAPLSKEAFEPSGSLKVYTATEQQGDSDLSYDVYTAYRIYFSDGKLFKEVSNSVSLPDEPQVVSLPAGTYTVEARAEGFWAVKVPVVIEDGRLTMVHLQRDSRRSIPPGEEASWVRLPDGQLVGWRAHQPSSR